MLKKIQLFLLAFVTSVMCFGQQKDYLITSYGAKPDGIINNTTFIQKAIDDANKNGGGRVLVPQGKFLTGVIHLESNVELCVEKNAILLASTNRDDYGPSEKASAGL